jgi:CheY-like chemotaxis protein
MAEGRDKETQILLVEDNLTDATLIRTLLERDGDIRVTLAQDGIRGCQLVESRRWSLVITDFNLPGRDGIDVIQASKTHQPSTPVLVTSAYSGPAFSEGASRAGAVEVLFKPIDPEGFMTTVRDLLTSMEGMEAPSRKVLAVGALPGDVEAGCGGSLLKHSYEGDKIQILILSSGPPGQEGEDRRAATRKACDLMGAHLILPPEKTPDFPGLDEIIIRLHDVVSDFSPEIIYAPSPRDVRESRQLAYEASVIVGNEVKSLFCYQAATTTLEFRPTRFENIAEFLDQKMAALSHYQAQVRGRPHLDPDLARASARYWGRFLGYGEVEPFEVVRHNL